MITGDNPLTACHVAKELKIARSKIPMLILTAPDKKSKWLCNRRWQYKINYRSLKSSFFYKDKCFQRLQPLVDCCELNSKVLIFKPGKLHLIAQNMFMINITKTLL